MTIRNNETVLIADAANREEIDSRVAQIKKELAETDSTYDQEKLSERIAKLAGGVAVIKVRRRDTAADLEPCSLWQTSQSRSRGERGPEPPTPPVASSKLKDLYMALSNNHDGVGSAVIELRPLWQPRCFFVTDAIKVINDGASMRQA